MKIYISKKRIIISSMILIILIELILFNYNAYIAGESFNYLPFILSIIVSLLACFIFAIKIDFNDKVNMAFTIISFILSIFFSYIIIELLNQNIPFSLYTKRLIFNFIVIILLHMFIYSISNKVNLTIILSNLIIFILGLINYTVTCFRGTPLVPWDVLSLKTAAYVATSYTFKFTYYLLLSISLFAFIVSIGLKASYIFKKEKTSLAVRFAFLLIVLISTMSFYNSNIIEYFDFENNLWKPTDEYQNNGFLASFVKQSKNLFNDAPKNYSLDAVENILNELEDEIYQDEDVVLTVTNTADNDKPNIIVIMNESYSDLTVNRRF